MSTQETDSDDASQALKRKLLDFAADFPFFNHMGLEVEDIGPGFARVSVELVDHLQNPNGQMHGGVIATLVDMSITQAMLMTDTYQRVRETRGLMTNVDLRMKYLRAVGAGRATVESRIVHEGRRVVHAASTVTDDRGKTVALGDATLMIVLGEGSPNETKEKAKAQKKDEA
ncbi:MAG: PaaI family thioesterase [bacterium]|nr:PaaI family thioesterase [bacterium]